MTSATAVPHMGSTNGEKIIYNTFTMCPRCNFGENSHKDGAINACQEMDHGKPILLNGFDVSVPGKVILRESDRSVWFVMNCAKHGQQRIMYCSHADFFLKCLRYSPGRIEQQGKILPSYKSGTTQVDVHELQKRIFNPFGTMVDNRPLMIEIEVVHKSSGQGFSDQHIEKCLRLSEERMGMQTNFVISVPGTLSHDISIFNRKIRHLLQCNKRKNPVMVDLTFDRIAQLGKLHDSVLEDPRVHPCVQIYVEKDQESNSVQELSVSLQTLAKTYTGMKIVVKVVIQHDTLPDLSQVLMLLRGMRGLIRFIIIDLERSPTAIMNQMSDSSPGSWNADPMPLLKHIEDITNGEISIGDFFPSSIGALMEPFLAMLGMGSYSIRPSPWCSFSTLLVNTDSMFHSVPISRIFDIDKLFQQMFLLLPKLKKNNYQIGIQTGLQIKKIMSQCQRPNMRLPDLFSHVTAGDNSDKWKSTKNVIDNCQILIIQNTMDVGMVDLVRRSRCATSKVNSQVLNMPQGDFRKHEEQLLDFTSTHTSGLI